jgi:hypothetical protein
LPAAILAPVAVLALLVGRTLIALTAIHRHDTGDALAVEAAEAGIAIARRLALLAAAVGVTVGVLTLLAERAAVRLAAKSDAAPATQCPPSQVRPGEQSHAVRHCVLKSCTHTWAAQSAQVGQLGTHVHRYPVGQLAAPFAWLPQIEIGAGQTRSTLVGSLACAAGNSPITARQTATTRRTRMDLPEPATFNGLRRPRHIPNGHAARWVAMRD